MPKPQTRRRPLAAASGLHHCLGGQDQYNNLVGPVQLLLGRLDGVRKSARGWIARCPAHQDGTPSLSVGFGDDGRILVYCFAGCPIVDVVTAVGMCVNDLFPPRRATKTSHPQRNVDTARLVETKILRDADRAREQRDAQFRALRIWHQGTDPDPLHAYLVAKSVHACGIRQSGQHLIVPMRDEAGTLWSVQTIAPDGTKRFIKGSRKVGLYHAICRYGPHRSVIAICEGYATAASIHDATGYATAVAFDAGNMTPVAIALREKYPAAQLVICADNDRTTQRLGRNPGVEAAHRAAQAARASIALPPNGFCDFNDALNGTIA